MFKGCKEPEASGAGKGAIDKAASDFRHGVGLAIGDDLESLITALGGKICHLDTDTSDFDESASVDLEDDDSFTIFLPRFISPEQRRFLIAHKLGHYLLHAPVNGNAMKAARSSNGLADREATWFAASFLMPKKEFTERFWEYNRDLSEVSRDFGVSLSTAEARARSLGLPT